MTTRKCSICGTRTIGTGPGTDANHARTMGYCNPCLTEGEWENMHSDYAHDAEDCVTMGYDTQDNLDTCWVCHPELNPNTDEYAPRGHTDTATHSHTSHTGHNHPRTPAARSACRKSLAAGHGPFDVRKI